MITERLQRQSSSRSLPANPAWWIVPLGVAGCLLIGLVMGVMQSPALAAAMLGGHRRTLGAVVVVRPEWALVIYTILAVNLNSIDLPVPGGVRVSPDILLTSLLIVGVALRALTLRRRVFSLPITAPYLIFLAVPAVTLIWSPTPVESLKGIFRFVGYYAIMLLIVDVIRTKGQLRHMVLALCWRRSSPSSPVSCRRSPAAARPSGPARCSTVSTGWLAGLSRWPTSWCC
ncbi:MAG: hypothetical protein R2844_00295 [Caldilineales bacterium]